MSKFEDWADFMQCEYSSTRPIDSFLRVWNYFKGDRKQNRKATAYVMYENGEADWVIRNYPEFAEELGIAGS